MVQYLNTLEHVLKNGTLTDNRTGIKTLSAFGLRMEFDLQKGFPLVTTKKVFFPAIVHELIWFIKGDTNIEYLVKNNVNIWNEWPFEIFQKSPEYSGQTLDWFKNEIATNHDFAKKWGELGPVYGKQWRDFNGIDQLKNLIDDIQNNPTSRRLIVSAWNPKDVPSMALPPCHALFQFKVLNQELHCQLYQRSADLFLGVPFNIASYALLTQMIAHVTGLTPGKFIHILGDAHIYENHVDQVKLQLTREPKRLPSLKLNESIKDIFAFKFEDVSLNDYEFWPRIVGEVAV